MDFRGVAPQSCAPILSKAAAKVVRPFGPSASRTTQARAERQPVTAHPGGAQPSLTCCKGQRRGRLWCAAPACAAAQPPWRPVWPRQAPPWEPPCALQPQKPVAPPSPPPSCPCFGGPAFCNWGMSRLVGAGQRSPCRLCRLRASANWRGLRSAHWWRWARQPHLGSVRERSPWAASEGVETECTTVACDGGEALISGPRGSALHACCAGPQVWQACPPCPVSPPEF